LSCAVAMIVGEAAHISIQVNKAKKWILINFMRTP
jgi:hypothetical protein